MDNKRRNGSGANNSSGSYGTRRVYAPEGSSRRQYESAPRARVISTEADRRRKIQEARKRRRQRSMRIRAAIITSGCAVVAAVLLFMSPLLDIRQITLEGNALVSKDAISEKVGYLIGKNIFFSSSSVIIGKMLEIPQISNVEVRKKLFPPELTLIITESAPAGYLLSGNTTVVINSDMKVIDDSGSYSTASIPSLSGISISSYKLNEKIVTDSAEKDAILAVLLKNLEKCGMLSSVTYISLDDLANIKFNYQNRIEVTCGSELELDRKIRMFSEAINSPSLSSDAIGSMDLSTPGQAIYTP